MKDTPVRIMQFELDPKEVRQSIPNMAFALGLSMTFPHLEPYLIRTMRVALEHTTDEEEVAREVKIFIGQEAQHFRQHRVLNDLLRNCHEQYAGLQQIEDDMEADYQRFTKKKSLRFNLAYAEGFEAATCALARNRLKYTDPDAETTDFEKLFSWHLTEEIEHRTVTFNIYKHLYGDYFYRLFVGIYGQYHFFNYVRRFAKFIKANQPTPDPTIESAKTFPGKVTEALSLAASWFGTYMPWYDPSKIKIPRSIDLLSARYSKEALETRVIS